MCIYICGGALRCWVTPAACRLPPAACLRSAGSPWQRRRLQEKRPMADRPLPIEDACKRRRLQEKRPMAPRMLVGASSV